MRLLDVGPVFVLLVDDEGLEACGVAADEGSCGVGEVLLALVLHSRGEDVLGLVVGCRGDGGRGCDGGGPAGGLGARILDARELVLALCLGEERNVLEDDVGALQAVPLGRRAAYATDEVLELHDALVKTGDVRLG